MFRVYDCLSAAVWNRACGQLTFSVGVPDCASVHARSCRRAAPPALHPCPCAPAHLGAEAVVLAAHAAADAGQTTPPSHGSTPPPPGPGTRVLPTPRAQHPQPHPPASPEPLGRIQGPHGLKTQPRCRSQGQRQVLMRRQLSATSCTSHRLMQQQTYRYGIPRALSPPRHHTGPRDQNAVCP